jgi:hypothetical protein
MPFLSALKCCLPCWTKGDSIYPEDQASVVQASVVQGSVAQAAVAQAAVAQAAVAQAAVVQAAVVQAAVVQAAVVQAAVVQGSVSQGSVSQGSASQGSASQGSASQGSASQGSASQASASEASASEGFVARISKKDQPQKTQPIPNPSIIKPLKVSGSKDDDPFFKAVLIIDDPKVVQPEITQEAKRKEFIRILKSYGIKHQKYLDFLAQRYSDMDIRSMMFIEIAEKYIIIDLKMQYYEDIGIKNNEEKNYLDILRNQLENIYLSSIPQDVSALTKQLNDFENEFYMNFFLDDLINANLNTNHMKLVLEKLDFFFNNKRYEDLNLYKKRIIEGYNYVNFQANKHKTKIDDSVFQEILRWACEPKDLLVSVRLEEFNYDVANRLLRKLVFKDDPFQLDGGKVDAPKAPLRGLLSDARALSVTSSVVSSTESYRESPVLDVLNNK